MYTRRRFLLISALASVLAVSGMATAQSNDKAHRKAAKRKAQQDALRALQNGEILPLMRVLEIALAQVPGKVIETEYKVGPKYEIKILTPEGRIREVKLDARTGEVLKIKDKH